VQLVARTNLSNHRLPKLARKTKIAKPATACYEPRA
jgi:hypothetical protein